MGPAVIRTALALRRSLRRFRQAVAAVEEIAEESEPVSVPPPGARSGRLGDRSRETSTNAQMQGAADEPWGGNR